MKSINTSCALILGVLTLFLGMPGLNVDGGKYCIEAIENGAEADIIGHAAKQDIGSFDQKRVTFSRRIDYLRNCEIIFP